MKRVLIIVGATAAGVVMFVSTVAIIGSVFAAVVTAPFDTDESKGTTQRDAAQHKERSNTQQEKAAPDKKQPEKAPPEEQPEKEQPEEAPPEEEPAEEPEEEQPDGDITKEEAYLNEMQADESGWQGTMEYGDDVLMLLVGDTTCLDLTVEEDVDSVVFENEMMYGVDTAAAEYQVEAAATHLCPEMLDKVES